MFGLEYLVAFIKIFFNIGFAIVSAIPVYFCWNALAEKYLYFLPIAYHKIGYWEFVGLFIILAIVGEYINKAVPKIVNVTTTASNT